MNNETHVRVEKLNLGEGRTGTHVTLTKDNDLVFLHYFPATGQSPEHWGGRVWTSCINTFLDITSREAQRAAEESIGQIFSKKAKT
jgi:hypothetical protein